MSVLTVAALAHAKQLPGRFLSELGLRDTAQGVAIPYRDESGKVSFERVRLALDGEKRFLQPTGVPVMPYGLERLEEARKRGQPLILVEGESDSWTLWYAGLLALGLPGASTARKLERWHLEGFQQVFVMREPGQGGDTFVRGVGGRLSEIGFSGEAYEVSIDGFKDASDLYCDDPERFCDRFEKVLHHASLIGPQTGASAGGAIRVYNVAELLSLELPKREFVLEPIFQERDAMMIFSWRGVGKTLLGLSIAHAIATGGCCLRWHAPRPRRVLYIDGELPLQTLQERVAMLIGDDPFDPAYLRFLTHDAQERCLPDLGTRGGQEALREIIEMADVPIFDSLSTLMRCVKENEAEGWAPMQEFLLDLRRAGKSTILLHHEGKGGTQRGTSKREDILDTVLHLRRPSGYSATEGARFEIHFEKCRALFGDSANAFEARLDANSSPAGWLTRDIEDANLARTAELSAIGMSVRDVARELNISKSKAQRLKQQAGEVSQRPTA